MRFKNAEKVQIAGPSTTVARHGGATSGRDDNFQVCIAIKDMRQEL